MTKVVYEKTLKLLPLVNDGKFFISCLYEPTLHPEFIQFLEKIPKKFRKKAFFTTNLATKISDEEIERLSHISLHHINISIDSFNPVLYETLRKGGKFDRFVNNLERLVDVFSRSSDAPPIQYITVVLKSNFDEIPTIVEKCAKLYLGTMHEARFVYEGSHINVSPFSKQWRRKNLISNDDWKRLQQYADKCPFNFVVVPPPSNYYKFDMQPYSRSSKTEFPETLPLALIVNSGGIVSLYSKSHVHFNIDIIDDPYDFFKRRMSYFQSLINNP